MKILISEQQFERLVEKIINQEEGNKDFITKLVDVDPTTGKLSWDIEYRTNLDNTYKEIDEAVERLQVLVTQYKGDTDAIELLELSRTLRNKFSRYRSKH